MYNYRAVMADIYANRRLRLRQLIEERFDGYQRRLAKAAGLGLTTVNRVLHGTGNLTEYATQKIEEALGLGHGWFNRAPPPGAVSKSPHKARMGPRRKCTPMTIQCGSSLAPVIRRVR